MNGRHLAKIARRLTRVRSWLNDRERRNDLNRLLDEDLPDLIGTVREHNLRGQQGKCRYCGQPLRLAHGPVAGLYAMYTTEGGVLCQDPNCPSPDSPDGMHHTEGEGQ